MRKLRTAAVVALMVGSVGMLGAGEASASDGPQRILVDNPQILNCEYQHNNVTGTVGSQVSGVGDSTSSSVIGNICSQTAPTFG